MKLPMISMDQCLCILHWLERAYMYLHVSTCAWLNKDWFRLELCCWFGIRLREPAHCRLSSTVKPLLRWCTHLDRHARGRWANFIRLLHHVQGEVCHLLSVAAGHFRYTSNHHVGIANSFYLRVWLTEINRTTRYKHWVNDCVVNLRSCTSTYTA